jgi:putative peptidoglycan binding protein
VRHVLAPRSDHDHVDIRPRGPTRYGTRSLGTRLLSVLLLRPGLFAGGFIIAGVSAMIIVNALSLQSSRHRYPIFAKSDRPAAAERRSEPSAPSVAPTPPSRPVLLPTPAVPPAVPRVAGRDLIGEMIRASDTTGSAPPSLVPEVQPDPQRLVASAQRALVKLGYGPLKTDGVFGPGTRQAIERFERDRRLTETGELGPRTVRELSAQSSIRVE